MNDEISLFLLKKYDKELKDVLTKLSEVEKKVIIIEHKLSNDKKNIESTINEIEYLKSRKLSEFLYKNWTKIPQAAVIVGGLLWFANWLYDLPSPKQQDSINKLVSHIESHKNNK